MSKQCDVKILVVGRRGCGKSTLIDTILNYVRNNNTYKYESSDTANHNNEIVITYETDNIQYNLHFYELNSNEEGHPNLSTILATCKFNIICFVSKAGDTHRLDIDYFRMVKQMLDTKLSDQYDLSDMAMMVLTHCDEYADDTLAKFKHNIKTHEESGAFYDYCKLGFYEIGGIVEKTLQAPDEETRSFIIKTKKTKIEQMCPVLLRTFADPSVVEHVYDGSKRGEPDVVHGQDKIARPKGYLAEYFPDGTMLGIGNLEAYSAKFINVLVIGCSKTGKTTLIKSLIDPHKATSDIGFDKRVTMNPFMLTDKRSGKSQQFNFIDTPGFNEHHWSYIMNNTNNNIDQFLSIYTECEQRNMTWINLVCYVINGNDMKTDDTKMFKFFNTYLYPLKSMLVVTHCDTKSNNECHEIIEHIRNDKRYYNCELGVYCYGTIDNKIVESQPLEDRKGYLEVRLTRVEKWREDIFQKITDYADCVYINELICEHQKLKNEHDVEITNKIKASQNQPLCE